MKSLAPSIVPLDQQPLALPEPSMMSFPQFKTDDEEIGFFERATALARDKKLTRLREEEREVEARLQAIRREIAEVNGKGQRFVRNPSIPDAELFERALNILPKSKAAGISGAEVGRLLGMEGNQRIPYMLGSEAAKKDGKVLREGNAKATRFWLR